MMRTPVVAPSPFLFSVLSLFLFEACPSPLITLSSPVLIFVSIFCLSIGADSFLAQLRRRRSDLDTNANFLGIHSPSLFSLNSSILPRPSHKQGEGSHF